MAYQQGQLWEEFGSSSSALMLRMTPAKSMFARAYCRPYQEFSLSPRLNLSDSGFVPAYLSTLCSIWAGLQANLFHSTWFSSAKRIEAAVGSAAITICSKSE